MEEAGFTLLPINDFCSSRTFQTYFGANIQSSACLTGYDDFVNFDALYCHEMLVRLSSSDVSISRF